MAPRQSSAQRRSIVQSEAFHDLGVRGRKTGVFLKDSGVRDEHGMQPMDDIFSSPDKDSQNGVEDEDQQEDEEEDDDDDDDEDDSDAPMDIDETTGPAPTAFMNSKRFLPPARARSPLKTNLQSPARRPLGMSSSPLRASNIVSGSPSGAKSVQRRLDFKNNLIANKPTLPQPNGVKGKGKVTAATNGHRMSPEEEEEEEEEEQEHQNGDESMAILDGAGDDYDVEDADMTEPEDEAEPAPEEEEEEEEEEEAPPPSVKKGKGRPKKTPALDQQDAIVESIEEDAEPVDEPARAGKKRGRPAKSKAVQEDKPAKKAKRSPDVGDEEGESSQQAPTAKVRGRKPKQVAEGTDSTTKKPAIPKQKRAGKQLNTDVGDTSIAEVPRGPPLPKSRGLVITRRETPDTAFIKTRSGRSSYQPLKFWRGERAELDDDAILDDGKGKIMLPHIKEIVRYDEPEPDFKPAGRRKSKHNSRKVGRPRAVEVEDNDLEPWEEDGDIIKGEVVVWQPEYETEPPGPDDQIEVAADEKIAISMNGIQTDQIRNASFKFAKLLSTPFFGAGVVDMPPHSEKKPKNARRMQMVFFIFSGRVQVTVADTVFNIGKGGMWFVPRGNYYSIENLGNQPARIFFAQGCELTSMSSGDISQLA